LIGHASNLHLAQHQQAVQQMEVVPPMKRNSIRSLILISMFLLSCGFLGVVFGQRSTQSASRESEVRENVKRFTEIYSLIEENYAEPVDPDKAIYNGAIPGMLHALDPHSLFFDGRSYSSFNEEKQGRYGGVGMEIVPREGKIIVIAPFSGSPAYRAGIRPGDAILAIDGKPVENLIGSKVSDLLKGPKGTQVLITIAREGADHPLEFHVVRDEIPRNSVDLAFHITPGIGYLHVNGFHETTEHEVAEALGRLGELKGLILDLRGNPGGLVDQAVGVADKFLKKGSVVVSQGGRAMPKQVFYANHGDNRNYPLVVLINRGTASAAEIVAGAIQDHDRGLILGETSFGKGLVQSVFPLSNKTGLALTTGRYYTPSGRLIQRNYNGVSLFDYYFRRQAENQPPAGKEIRLTDSGRTVFGGGGITPDKKLDTRLNQFQDDLLRQYVFFNFSKHYMLGRHIGPDFQVTDEVLQQFRSFLSEQNVHAAEADLVQAQDWIKANIKAELFTSEFGQDEGLKVQAQTDPAVQKALEFLPEAKQLAENARRLSAQKSKAQVTTP
jgi:carboxyl-terminal processing protease